MRRQTQAHSRESERATPTYRSKTIETPTKLISHRQSPVLRKYDSPIKNYEKVLGEQADNRKTMLTTGDILEMKKASLE